ncbi:hypothetical protein [Mycobacterium sp. MAA66]
MALDMRAVIAGAGLVDGDGARKRAGLGANTEALVALSVLIIVSYVVRL